jgi:hypothetical protein
MVCSKRHFVVLTVQDTDEERGAATQEISCNVQQVAQSTQQVASNITDVQRRQRNRLGLQSGAGIGANAGER